MDDSRGFYFWLAFSAAVMTVTICLVLVADGRSAGDCEARGGVYASGMCLQPGSILP